MLGMSILHIEELHTQLTCFEYTIWLLAHNMGFLVCLRGYKSMCWTPVFAFVEGFTWHLLKTLN